MIDCDFTALNVTAKLPKKIKIIVKKFLFCQKTASDDG